MTKIASGNVEVYIRQLLSEELFNDAAPVKQVMDEKMSKDENCKLTNRKLSKKTEG
jgi:hypothetical protein